MGGSGAEDLDDEGDYVQPHEELADAPGGDVEDFGRGHVVVYHPAEDHVHEGVGPERGDQDQDEPAGVGAETGWVKDAEDSDDVGACLE